MEFEKSLLRLISEHAVLFAYQRCQNVPICENQYDQIYDRLVHTFTYLISIDR